MVSPSKCTRMEHLEVTKGDSNGTSTVGNSLDLNRLIDEATSAILVALDKVANLENYFLNYQSPIKVACKVEPSEEEVTSTQTNVPTPRIFVKKLTDLLPTLSPVENGIELNTNLSVNSKYVSSSTHSNGDNFCDDPNSTLTNDSGKQGNSTLLYKFEVFVTKLPSWARNEDVVAAFEAVGIQNFSLRVINRPDHSFAFLQLTREEDMKTALSLSYKLRVYGQPVYIRPSRKSGRLENESGKNPEENPSPVNGSFEEKQSLSFSGESIDPSKCSTPQTPQDVVQSPHERMYVAYIARLPSRTRTEDLIRVLEQSRIANFGIIIKSKLDYCYGFLNFTDKENYYKALQLSNKLSLYGYPIAFHPGSENAEMSPPCSFNSSHGSISDSRGKSNERKRKRSLSRGKHSHKRRP